MRFQEIEKLTFREIFFSIFFHYLLSSTYKCNFLGADNKQ